MRIIDLVGKDLLLIIRDWKSFLFLLTMPVLFTLVFGFAFGGFDTGSEETAPCLPVGFLDRDRGSPGQFLLDVLEMSDANQAAVNRLLNAVQAARFSTQSREVMNPFQSQAARETYFERSLEKAVAAWENPPFNVVSTQTGKTDPFAEANAFAHSSPGMMVQFGIAGLISAAGVLVVERKSGSLKRLLTTAMSRMEILLGHFLAMFSMVLAQFTILIVFAAVLLDVAYFKAPLATICITLTTTLFIASMGMLIGTMARKEEQVIIFSLIPMSVLSGLGGAWVPLEMTSPAFQTIGRFTPIAWAMEGFQNIIILSMGLESVLLPS